MIVWKELSDTILPVHSLGDSNKNTTNMRSISVICRPSTMSRHPACRILQTHRAISRVHPLPKLAIVVTLFRSIRKLFAELGGVAYGIGSYLHHYLVEAKQPRTEANGRKNRRRARCVVPPSSEAPSPPKPPQTAKADCIRPRSRVIRFSLHRKMRSRKATGLGKWRHAAELVDLSPEI